MDLAEAHNILDRNALRERGFADTEELLLPLPDSDSDSTASPSHEEALAKPLVIAEFSAGSLADVDEVVQPVAETATMPAMTNLPVHADKAVVREVSEGPLGMQVFPSSRVLLHWLLEDPNAPSLKGKKVLELGSGTGALAISLLMAEDGPSVVYASEGDAEVFANLEYNITANHLQASVRAVHWSWDESHAPPDDVDVAALDIVLGADIVYVGTAEADLAAALSSVLKKGCNGNGINAYLLLADRPPGGFEFLPAAARPEDDESSDSAVDRFLAACHREEMEVETLQLPDHLIEAVLQDKHPDGTLCLFRLWGAR